MTTADGTPGPDDTRILPRVGPPEGGQPDGYGAPQGGENAGTQPGVPGQQYGQQYAEPPYAGPTPYAGQPPYGGQSPYGQPGQGTEPPKSSGRTWLIVALAILGGVLLGGAIAYFATGGAGVGATTGSQTASQTAIVPTTPPPPAVVPTTPPPAQPKPEPEPEPKPPAVAEKDTTPPKTPIFTYPANNYWLSPSNMKVELKWNRVSDPSGVSYVIERAEWLGGGAGWTNATRTDPMKRLYYEYEMTSFKEHYRIIAIDGEGNESDPGVWRFLMQAADSSEAASMNANYHD